VRNAVAVKGANADIMLSNVLKHAPSGVTPIIFCASCGLAELLTILLKEAKTPPNLEATDKYGRTALHRACNSNNLRDAEIDTYPFLFEHKAGGPEADGKGYTQCITVLLEYGANMYATDKHGFTPLHHTLRRGLSRPYNSLCNDDESVDFVKALCAAGGTGCVNNASNTLSTNGTTPLMMAARIGYLGAVLLLLELEGVDVHATDNDGKTALDHADACARKSNLHGTGREVDRPYQAVIQALIRMGAKRDGNLERFGLDLTGCFNACFECCCTTGDTLSPLYDKEEYYDDEADLKRWGLWVE
jgi:hypothetical protein